MMLRLYWTTFTLLTVALPWRSCAQAFGFRSLPITGRRNQSRVFIPELDSLPLSGKFSAASIDNELAAIFRGVAYGAPTEPVSSTTTPSPTTPEPKASLEAKDGSGKQTSPNSPNSGINAGSDVQKFNESVKHIQDTDNELEDDFKEELIVTYEEKVSGNEGEHLWVTSLGVFWYIHVYLCAIVYTFLTFMSLWCFLRLFFTSMLLSKGYCMTIYSLVFLSSFFRCILFYFDPYAAKERLPAVLSNVLFNTGTPFTIAAFSLLIVGLLHIVNVQIFPPKLQSAVTFGTISALLIIGSFTAEFVEGALEDEDLSSALKIAMHALIAGWTAALCIGFIIIYRKVQKTAEHKHHEMIRYTFSRIHMKGSTSPPNFPKCYAKCGARLTLVASVAGLTLSILQVYGHMNRDLSTSPPSNVWLWFSYQSCCRLLEAIFWTCICIAAALPPTPSYYGDKLNVNDDVYVAQTSTSSKFSCASCWRLFLCYSQFSEQHPDDIYSNVGNRSRILRSTSFQGENKPFLQDSIASNCGTPHHVRTTLLRQNSVSNQSPGVLSNRSIDLQRFRANYSNNLNSSSGFSSLSTSYASGGRQQQPNDLNYGSHTPGINGIGPRAVMVEDVYQNGSPLYTGQKIYRVYRQPSSGSRSPIYADIPHGNENENHPTLIPLNHSVPSRQSDMNIYDNFDASMNSSSSSGIHGHNEFMGSPQSPVLRPVPPSEQQLQRRESFRYGNISSSSSPSKVNEVLPDKVIYSDSEVYYSGVVGNVVAEAE